jgi:hypothetical protein
VLWVVIALTALGGLLPLVALWNAGKKAGKKYGELDRQLREIDAILEASRTNDEGNETTTQRLHAVRQPTITSYGQQKYTAEIAERTLYDELRRPAITAAVGVVLATLGSLLSLCLN